MLRWFNPPVRHLCQSQTESVIHSPSRDVNLINPPVGTDSYPRADIGNDHELLLHTHPLQALWYFVSHLRYQLLQLPVHRCH